MNDLRTIISNYQNEFKKYKEQNNIKGFTEKSENYRNLEKILSNLGSDFEIKVSAGQTKAAIIPYIVMLNPNLSNGVQDGIYIDYLFTSSLKRVFLCLQLATKPFKKKKKDLNDLKKGLKEFTKSYNKKCSFTEINLMDDTKEKKGMAKPYEETIIFSKEYDFEKLPDNSEMEDDLHIFVQALNELAENKEIVDYFKKLRNSDLKLTTEKNIIYYGVPGTGKSHQVKEMLDNIPNKNSFRTTLHPEYTYSDFVGQVTPDFDDEKQKPTYKYQKGIFTQALDRALEVPDESIALVLEEMSRANVAAVFGDIF